MSSIWTQTASSSPRGSLAASLETDTVIIGAGMCGVLTGYLLSQAGVNVILLDANRIGSGQTQNTTAKITCQNGLYYHNLLEKEGNEKARQYADIMQAAIERYERLIKDLCIDCSFTRLPSYLYTTQQPDLLEKEALAASSLGIPCRLTEETTLPFPVKSALRFSNQAQFNPLPFLYTLAEKLTIYENTKVWKVTENQVITENHVITCKHIIYACHYPFPVIPGYYFLRMFQERSYVLALSQAAQLDGMHYGIDAEGLSLRNFGSLLLLGGQSHRTGQKLSFSPYEKLEQAGKQLFPQSRCILRWSAQDCMPVDNIPYIGSFSQKYTNHYVATGFRKWGMTASMAAAMILKDMICKTSSSYETVFSPNRSLSSYANKKFASHVGKTCIALSKEFFTFPLSGLKSVAPGEGKIIHLNGRKVGVYKDETGELFFVSTKCPHMGCQLQFNPAELSWDCPCHGSRFSYRGELIDGPAQKQSVSKNK